MRRDRDSDWDKIPALTTCGGHHLVQQLHTGALPDFLNYCSQLFVGLLQVTCRVKIIRDRDSADPAEEQFHVWHGNLRR